MTGASVCLWLPPPDALLCCRCATPLDSSHSAVQFVASMRPNVINFVLNTSYIIPEVSVYLKRLALVFFSLLLLLIFGIFPKLFIHCTVLISDQGTTPGSKSCNYDATQSRCVQSSFLPPLLHLSNTSACVSDGRT